MTTDPFDRSVHAISRDRLVEVVRYDKAGKYWREERTIPDGPVTRRDPLQLPTAVSEALYLEADGGTVYLNRCGGMAFDAKVRKMRKDMRR